jgi:hypothetical protein
MKHDFEAPKYSGSTKSKLSITIQFDEEEKGTLSLYVVSKFVGHRRMDKKMWLGPNLDFYRKAPIF